MSKIINKINKKDMIIIIALLSFAFLFASPLNPFFDSISNTDSSGFRKMAMMMDSGYMPYRDSFDHKGPLIYVINFIGMKISADHGVWLIEYLSLFVSLFFIHLISKLAGNSNGGSLFVILISVLMLSEYFQGGNFIEEYALPATLISMYIFLDYFLNNNVNNFRLTVLGFCFGIVAMLRINIATLWVAFCLSITLMTIAQKKYKDLLRFIAFFIIGTGIIVLPFLIWLGANDCLEDFWYSYMTFNRQYMASENSLRNFFETAKYFYSAVPYIVSLTAMIILAVFEKEKRSLYVTVIFYLIINIPLISLSGRPYGHYGIILIPAISLSVAILLERVRERYNRVALLFISLVLFFGSISSSVFWVNSVYENIYITPEAKQVIDASEYIRNNTETDDRISVYGNYDIIYVLSNRLHATKYSYQNPIVMDDYFNELNTEKPKLIITRKIDCDERLMDFINQNSYYLSWHEEDIISDSDYVIYQLK